MELSMLSTMQMNYVMLPSKEKKQRGGTRKNAGPKFKYGEPTTPVLIRVPNTKIAIFRTKAKEILKDWETKFVNNKTIKKTALQKLIEYMEENYHLTEESRLEFKKALEMEKQQILDAFNQGYREGISDAQMVTKNDKDVAEYQDAELYYNIIYKQ